MRGSRAGMMGALLAGANYAFSALPVVSNVVSPAPGIDGSEVFARPRRGKGQSNRRGKGIQAKPKKRPNRLTISKRIKRKHRRAK